MKHDDTMNTMAVQAKNDSTEAVLEKRCVEIHQQPHSQPRSLEIRQHLGRVKLLQPRHDLDFHQDDVLDDQVDPLARDQPLPVLHFDTLFALELDPARFEFEAKRSFVNLLAKTWSKFPVDGNSTRDCLCDYNLTLRRQQRVFLEKHLNSIVSIVSSCSSCESRRPVSVNY